MPVPSAETQLITPQALGPRHSKLSQALGVLVRKWKTSGDPSLSVVPVRTQ